MPSSRRSFLTALASPLLAADSIDVVPVFREGADGYASFRIPALLRTRKGTLLAFCEGRKGSRSDTGEIDVVVKRSTDQGATWSALQVVATRTGFTVGNPCPVEHRKSRRILLPLTMNPATVTEKQIVTGTAEGTRTVWLSASADDGRSWETPAEITEQVKAGDWTWYATGPGNGIVTRHGRIVIPCDHIQAGTRAMNSHVIYSDDGGRSWQRSEPIGPKTNECQVAELADGTLQLNMRSYHQRYCRAIAHSRDGGANWSALTFDETLIDPVCQASLIADGAQLYFSNAASRKRENLTVRSSPTRGRTWPGKLVLYPGPAAYSSLALLGGGRLGCLFERGRHSPYEEIVLARFSRKLPRE